MIKFIIISFGLVSINSISQVSISQTVKIFKPNKDSCSIFTKISNNRNEIFKSEIRCKTIDSDSLSLIELRKTKLIQANIHWSNKK